MTNADLLAFHRTVKAKRDELRKLETALEAECTNWSCAHGTYGMRPEAVRVTLETLERKEMAA